MTYKDTDVMATLSKVDRDAKQTLKRRIITMFDDYANAYHRGDVEKATTLKHKFLESMEELVNWRDI